MTKTSDQDLLPEYDFSKGVRGKYVARVAKGSNVVVLDKDVQNLFPDSVAVTRRAPRPKAAARKRAAA